MATASAFGFSGYDPFGSMMEHSVNGHYSREMARFNAKLQYNYAQKYAYNAPSWNRKGMEAAGYNPMINALNGTTGQVNTPSINGSILGSNSSGGFDANAFSAAKNAIKQTRLNNENTESQTNKNNAEAEAAKKQGDAAIMSAQALQKNADTNRGSAIEHGINRSVSSALDAASTGSALTAGLNSGAPASKSAVSQFFKAASRVGVPAATSGAVAGNLGLGSVGAVAGAAPSAYLGMQYGLGKALESKMTKDDHKAFQKASEKNSRMRREQGKPDPSKAKKKKRRHN